MSKQESIRALADELRETVTLAEKLHDCVQKDSRRVSGKFPTVRSAELKTLADLGRPLP